jgi:hypothetical protein
MVNRRDMLTLEQLPKKTVDAVLSVLSVMGFNKISVQVCAYGIAATNLGIDDEDESKRRITEIRENRIKNNREYVRQVMTIYSNEVAGTMFDLAQLERGRYTDEQKAEMKLRGDKLIQDTIARHIDTYVDDGNYLGN